MLILVAVVVAGRRGSGEDVAYADKGGREHEAAHRGGSVELFNWVQDRGSTAQGKSVTDWGLVNQFKG